MSNPFIREGETHQEHLGDGLYAAFDGYQIWLRAERDGMTHEVAVEPPVMARLRRYADEVFGPTDLTRR